MHFTPMGLISYILHTAILNVYLLGWTKNLFFSKVYGLIVENQVAYLKIKHFVNISCNLDFNQRLIVLMVEQST